MSAPHIYPCSAGKRWGDRPDLNRLPSGSRPDASATSASTTMAEGVGLEPTAVTRYTLSKRAPDPAGSLPSAKRACPLRTRSHGRTEDEDFSLRKSERITGGDTASLMASSAGLEPAPTRFRKPMLCPLSYDDVFGGWSATRFPPRLGDAT